MDSVLFLCVYSGILLIGLLWTVLLAVADGIAEGAESVFEGILEIIDSALESVNIDFLPAGFGAESGKSGSGIAFGIFLITLGATGLAFSSIFPGINGWIVVPITFILGVAAFVATIAAFGALNRNLNQNMATTDEDFVGKTGTLTAGISNGDAGVLPLVIRGQTVNKSCKTADGSNLPRGTHVKVIRNEGVYAIVEKA